MNKALSLFGASLICLLFVIALVATAGCSPSPPAPQSGVKSNNAPQLLPPSKKQFNQEG